MKFLAFVLIVFLTTSAFSDSSFILNVSLKTDVTHHQTQCFANEALNQAFPEYGLFKISHSTIDKSALSEEENIFASIYFLANHKVTGKVEQFTITISSFDSSSPWSYVQSELAIYPFSSKVSNIAQASRNNSSELPSSILLTNCK